MIAAFLDLRILQAAGAVKTTGADPSTASNLPALPPTIGGISVVGAPGRCLHLVLKFYC